MKQAITSSAAGTSTKTFWATVRRSLGSAGEAYSWAQPLPTEDIPGGSSDRAARPEQSGAELPQRGRPLGAADELLQVTLDGFLVSDNVTVPTKPRRRYPVRVLRSQPIPDGIFACRKFLAHARREVHRARVERARHSGCLGSLLPRVGHSGCLDRFFSRGGTLAALIASPHVRGILAALIASPHAWGILAALIASHAWGTLATF